MESRYTWKNQVIGALRSIAIVGGIVLLMGYLVFVSNQAARKELEDIFTEQKEEVTVINEPVAYGYENGAKIWELRSEVAQTEKATQNSELTRIYELTLYKGGEENVLIRGDGGAWDKQREELTLDGNVQVESADGTTTLTTQKLTWQEQSKTLACPEYVDTKIEDNHIVANSLYSADDLATIDFVGSVEMFVVGLKGESFITREGNLPIEDIEGEPTGDGMNVLAAYVHYIKAEKSCDCLTKVPVAIQAQHHLDEQGRPVPQQLPAILMDPAALVNDPAYRESLQRSIEQMDLSPQEKSFLEGQSNSLPPANPPAGSSPALPQGPTSGPAPGIVPGGAGLPGGPSSNPLASPGQTNPTEAGIPALPTSDPTVVLSAPNYSRITGWQISQDLNAEKFEGDPDFDPYAESRTGQIFCYRNDKKIWCDEVHIDLGQHIIEALRRSDARFRNLEQKNREPAQSRAGQAIQKTPTQIIGNYLTHNWREHVTQGYGRVLAIQPEKDIEADNVIYYEEPDAIHAWGRVIVHQYGGQWWEASGAMQDIHEERAREDVKQPTVITADALLSYNKKVSWAFGNVVFRQEKQTVTSDRAQYEDSTEILVMAGSVNYESKDGERVQCALLTLDMYLEEYIAEGAAIARNIVPEEHREDIQKYRNEEERQPGDDARARLLEKRTAAGLGNWSEEIQNPPSPPPIEVLPNAEGQVQPLPQLGPEVPPAGSNQNMQSGETSVPPGQESSGEPPVDQSAGQTESAISGGQADVGPENGQIANPGASGGSDEAAPAG